MWSVLVFVCICLQCGCVVGTRSHNRLDNLEPLYLTPLLEQGNVAEAQRQARVTPDIGNTSSYAGYFTVNKACESNLYFWFFPAQTNWEKAPLVLWLQGGPGAASLYSLFEENGPLTYKDGLGRRRYSWNVKNNLLFIDQPVGTGYSFTGKGCFAENETIIGEELYSAVVQFHQLFPNMKNNKFIIAGYSYAGHFIPALGHTIHIKNPSAKVKINLKGMMIGNGWMDALSQSDLGSYLYQLGLLDDIGRAVYYEYQEKFYQYMKEKEWQKALEARTAIVDELYLKYVGNVSILNYLRDITIDPVPYENFIQTPRIRKAIHVGNNNYSFINPQVAKSLGIDVIVSVKPWVEELVEHYPMVFYSGQLDIVCAYPLTVSFLKALNWSGKEDFKNATRERWCVGERQAGYFKRAGNLVEVMVRNAGHSVPIEQPQWAYVLANSVTSATDNPIYALRTC